MEPKAIFEERQPNKKKNKNNNKVSSDMRSVPDRKILNNPATVFTELIVANVIKKPVTRSLL